MTMFGVKRPVARGDLVKAVREAKEIVDEAVPLSAIPLGDDVNRPMATLAQQTDCNVHAEAFKQVLHELLTYEADD